MARHCLKIPFLVGPDAIIGHACADNPAWEVPRVPGTLDGVECVPGDFPTDAAVSVALPDGAVAAGTLTAPPVKVLTLT